MAGLDRLGTYGGANRRSISARRLGTAGTPTGEAVSAPAAPQIWHSNRWKGCREARLRGTARGVAAMFPAASGWLGPRRVAALAASTLLVGMVCPGLHSMYSSLTVRRLRGTGPGESARLPGGRDRPTFPCGALRHRGRWMGRRGRELRAPAAGAAGLVA